MQRNCVAYGLWTTRYLRIRYLKSATHPADHKCHSDVRTQATAITHAVGVDNGLGVAAAAQNGTISC